MTRTRGGTIAAMTTHAHTNQWTALPVLLAGAFMVVLDFFIVNVALPSIATDLGAGESSLEWVVAGYGRTFGAFLITAGRIGDEFGRRRAYAVGIGLFTAASAACGLAPSPGTLVLARVAQGVAGAVVMPQVLSIIGVTYKDGDYVRALSYYGVALGLAAVGGQVIGGALVQTDVAGLGWRGCFLINVPIGLAALAATPRFVPESRAPRRARIDLPEAGLVFTILAVAYVVVSGPAPELTKRFGRSVVAAGGASLAAGLLALALATAEVGVGGSILVLVPGLVLVGAGIGLCFTPLTSTVLSGIDPARAGAASGAMSTITQVGYALGVAVTGVIFFGAGHDLGHAFTVSLLPLGSLAPGIGGGSHPLPKP